ncbi:MAG: helix-turn-helix transcriptional regulator [Spirochaetes bacterium]|nr:helix-turn-helix transcriptional regulator [Spirochaetota bacterium]
MATNFWSGLEFLYHDHLPRCAAWIDRRFTDYAGLNFARAGSIEWQGPAEREPRPLTAPLCWWTWPGPRFRYGCPPGRHWDHYFVTFKGPRVRRYQAAGLLPKLDPSRAYVPVQDPDLFEGGWKRLLASLTRSGTRGNQEAVHLLEGLLLQLNQPIGAPPIRGRSPLDRAVDALAERLRSRPGLPCDWGEEAARIGVSGVHLRRRFQARFGQSPHQLLLQSRLDLAARFLRTSDTAILEIAAGVGMPDPHHFSKMFRARFRRSPRDYREEARQLYAPAVRADDPQRSF